MVSILTECYLNADTLNDNTLNNNNLNDNDMNMPDLTVTKETRTDRSFEAIADHFEKKVYGGLKGEIRLAVLRRDIFAQVTLMSDALGRPLRILDVGAGLAQIAIDLALQGHELVVNDISAAMLAKAKISFEQQQAHANQNTTDDSIRGKSATDGSITWYACPYQQLEEQLNAAKVAKFDLILCHALLEWLAEPAAIMDFFAAQLSANGALSLCFYNPASFDYRNLIMGNFNLLDNLLGNDGNQADNKKSLTPNHPVAKQQVETWLQQHHYKILLESGLRVFHDYAPLKRGGHNDPEAVIRMELRYSRQEPYKRLGRYLHILAIREA